MEGIFEALLQFLFEFVFELVGEIVCQIAETIVSQIDYSGTQNNFSNKISSSDEIISLNIYNYK